MVSPKAKAKKKATERPMAILCMVTAAPESSESEAGSGPRNWTVSAWAKPYLLDLEKISMLLPPWARESGGRSLERLGQKLVDSAMAQARENLAAEFPAGGEEAAPSVAGEWTWDSERQLALCVASMTYGAPPSEKSVSAAEKAFASAIVGGVSEKCLRKPGAFRRWEEAPDGYVLRHSCDSLGLAQEAGPRECAEEAFALLEAKDLEAQSRRSRKSSEPPPGKRRGM